MKKFEYIQIEHTNSITHGKGKMRQGVSVDNGNGKGFIVEKSLAGKNFIEVLNHYGKDRWELASNLSESEGNFSGISFTNNAILKREIAE